MDAFRAGRLQVRHNLHLGVGFLAATSGDTGPGRLRFRRIADPRRRLLGDRGRNGQAGPDAARARRHQGVLPADDPRARAGFRTIAIDLLGFGDSDKPIGASYGPRFQARGIAALLDALELDRAHLIGHSMGGRVALEAGFSAPERMLGPGADDSGDGVAARSPLGAVPASFVRPELGLLQITPRPVVEALLRRTIPGADTSMGQPRRSTSSSAPTRARAAGPPSTRRRATSTSTSRTATTASGPGCASSRPSRSSSGAETTRWCPIAFMKHVEEALPAARHVELDCGHIPQIQAPRATHAAIADFLGGVPGSGVAVARRRRHRRAAAAQNAPH